MGKRIIVTAGPTNEKIDSVMQVTNMSTGKLGAEITNQLMRYPREKVERVYYLSPKLAVKPNPDMRVQLLQITSAEDLLRELERLLTAEQVDAIIHSAAVGDYKAQYTIRAEDLAMEIATKLADPSTNKKPVYDLVMDVFHNPGAIQDSNTKISSYEENLVTKWVETPKVIGHIKGLSPDTLLIGFKLLKDEEKQHLFEVADRLRKSTKADYIMANDLGKIGNGRHWGMAIGKDGILTEFNTKPELAETIMKLIFGEEITKKEYEAE